MSRWRILGFALLCVICIGGAVTYVVTASDPTDHADGASPGDDLPAPDAGQVAAMLQVPHVVYRDTDVGSAFGQVAVVKLSDTGSPAVSDLSCERVDYSAGRGICLTVDRGAVTTYGATIFDQDLNTVSTMSLPGLPSRTRVSGDGRHAAMTTFVFGDSYTSVGFSTRTQLLDLASGESLGDLEQFTATKDGKVIDAVDRNYWGVTFGTGDEFYATLGTGDHHYLVKGDLQDRTVEVVTDGVECPSLSPDGTRVAFKKRSTGPLGLIEWRLSVLDLKTLEVTPLAETTSVDDQAEWLDDSTVLYGLPRGDAATPTTDVWSVPADGSGAPSIFLSGAWSPSVGQTSPPSSSTSSPPGSSVSP